MKLEAGQVFKILQHANLTLEGQSGTGRWPRKPYGYMMKTCISTQVLVKGYMDRNKPLEIFDIF